MGFYTSKSFLPKVSAASKGGSCACKTSLPALHGTVRRKRKRRRERERERERESSNKVSFFKTRC
jgi:hypothetical protein